MKANSPICNHSNTRSLWRNREPTRCSLLLTLLLIVLSLRRLVGDDGSRLRHRLLVHLPLRALPMIPYSKSNLISLRSSNLLLLVLLNYTLGDSIKNTLNAHFLENGVQILLDDLLGLRLLGLLSLLGLGLLLHLRDSDLLLLDNGDLQSHENNNPTVSVSSAKSSFRVSVQGISGVRCRW